MGSVDVLDAERLGERELTVLVTGFGPFRGEYPVNPSWEIASSLPAYLPAERAKDAACGPSTPLPAVRVLVHNSPVRVNYEVVRHLVPTLWDDGEHEIDVMVHIGMAGPAPVYQLERLAHRDGYRMRDVDRQFLDDEAARRQQGDGWIWHGVPDELTSDLDIEDVHRRLLGRCAKDKNIRISNDPGRFLCDFIYFSSLAHLWKQKRPRRVVFLHVPASADDEAVRSGTELTLQLIRSVVESELGKTAKAASEAASAAAAAAAA